jgi:hypothetical protein
MPLVDNFDAIVCQLVDGGPPRASDFQGFLAGVCFALLSSHIDMSARKRDIRDPVLRRKSMELLKDITQMLREILSSGDEEGLRRLEETIRSLEQNRHKPSSHVVH